jgi:hypothetical protein
VLHFGANPLLDRVCHGLAIHDLRHRSIIGTERESGHREIDVPAIGENLEEKVTPAAH